MRLPAGQALLRRVSSGAVELGSPRERLRLPALEAHGLTIAVAAVGLGVLLVLAAATGMVSDSWLALVGGREIAEHGLPSRDLLATVTIGRRWTDQQWLGQLTLYELHRATRGAFPIVLTLLAVLPSIVGAVRIGRSASTDRATAGIALIGLLPFLVPAAQPRTQSLAYPAFIGLLALLLRKRRTWVVRAAAIAIIALWANLHGSVLLGAAAASLCWLQELRSYRLRTAMLLAATWLATLCSPYALQLPAYYRSTVSNAAFAKALSQWQPLGFSAHALPTWLLIVATVWVIGRSGSRLWSFEPALLLAFVLLTVHSVRTSSFLALATIALLPRLARQPEPGRAASTVGARLAIASLALGALFTAAAVTHLRFSPYEPSAAAAAVEAAGAGKVFVPLELGDWLLWTKPELRGRVAADARAELLTQAELLRFAALWHGTDGWRRATAGYRALVLSPTGEPSLVRRLTADPARFRVVYRNPTLVVLLRRPPPAG
jgi:hypothetical protein